MIGLEIGACSIFYLQYLKNSQLKSRYYYLSMKQNKIKPFDKIQHFSEARKQSFDELID